MRFWIGAPTQGNDPASPRESKPDIGVILRMGGYPTSELFRVGEISPRNMVDVFVCP